MAVSTWIALALLALCAGEAAMIRHLYAHRALEIHMTALTLPPTEIHGNDNDEYVTHAFPADRNVCTFVNTICWIRI